MLPKFKNDRENQITGLVRGLYYQINHKID